jgi:hypothetical protein
MSLKNISILIFLFWASTAAAQNTQYLILKHKEKTKKIAIAEGSALSIKLKSGEKVRGEIVLINETTVRVKNRIINITDIESIGRKHQGIYRVAALIVTNGMNVFLFGMNDNLLNGWDKISNAHKASLPMLAVGVPLLTITHKRKAEHWVFLPVLKDW